MISIFRYGQITYAEIRQHIMTIYERLRETFKLNMSFGIMLRGVADRNLYQYFHPMESDRLIDTPFTISNVADIDRLMEKLNDMDLLANMVKQRKNTKWLFFKLTNVVFYVNKTAFVLGGESEMLPKHILNSRAIHALTHNRITKEPFNDNLCVFRCLALHEGHNIRTLEKITKRYFRQWVKFKKMPERNFSGLRLDEKEIELFEKCFSVNINIYELNENRVATVVHKTRGRYKSTMHCNVHSNHLSFIKNFKKYSSKYRCEKCDKHFRKLYVYSKHSKTCTNKGTVLVYPGGYLKPPQTIFDELEFANIKTAEEERYFNYVVCFDFEAILQPVTVKVGKQTAVTHEHRPVSVSVATNVKLSECDHSSHNQECEQCRKFKFPVCIIDENENELLRKFVNLLSEIQLKTSAITREKFSIVFLLIDQRLQKLHNRVAHLTENQGETDQALDRSIEENTSSPYGSVSEVEMSSEEESQEKLIVESYGDYDRTECKKEMKHLMHLRAKLETYCSQLPVLGFNSSKYDLNLIKQKLAIHLNLIEEEDKFIVKKGNSYMCIATPQFKFLDITQFIAPGYSYDKFLKAYNASARKGFFPYEYITSVEILDEETLPPLDKFYSSLKQHNVLESEWLKYTELVEKYKSTEKALREMDLTVPPPTEEENYQYLEQVWKNEGMKNLRDLLTWYNNLDTEPFLVAVESMLRFYREDQKIDLFKDAISVPGVARSMLYKQALKDNYYFSLFDSKHEHLYDKFKSNLVGGPSILCHRYMEAGKTFIRGDPTKICKKITGWDCNSLYLSCFTKPMPEGRFVFRHKNDGFYPHIRDKYDSQYDWLGWVSETERIDIRHARNGGERKIGV